MQSRIGVLLMLEVCLQHTLKLALPVAHDLQSRSNTLCTKRGQAPNQSDIVTDIKAQKDGE